jgi:hypothetical protein
MKTSIDSIRHNIVHMGTSTGLGVIVMVFNATFNNTSVISCQSVSLVEEIGVLPKVNDKLDHIMMYQVHLA